ncbi:MAG: DNA internalization-related competence protein ComEC/Rec2, partial [Limosilactobacillus sp.]|nr:DNA internalization-related competence protein ComEC/Rec2 [Limosilactobacillus sp.]
GLNCFSALIVWHQWWWLIGLAGCVVQYVRFTDVRWWSLGVGVAVIVGGRATQLANCYYQIPPVRSQVTQTVRVLPDQWQVNGNFAQAIGTVKHHQYLIRLRLQTRQEQQTLQHLTTPVQVTVTGKQLPIAPATNFNAFDRRFWYATQGINCQVTGRIKQMSRQSASKVAYLHQLRTQLGQRFACLPQPLAGYAQRILLGLKDATLAPQMTTAKQLGIVHLFCLSGLHVNVLCQGLARGAKWLRCPKILITLLQLIFLPIYWVLGGGAVSLSRAVLMAELKLLPRKRWQLPLDPWGTTLVLVTCWQPSVLMTLGGQLSFLLSFVLGYFKFKSPVESANLISLVSLGPLLHSVYEVHLLSFIINYLMIPVFERFMLPAIVVAVLTQGWLPWIGQWVNSSLKLIDQGLLALTTFPGEIHFGKIGVLMTIIVTLLTLVALEKRQFAWWGIVLMCYSGLYVMIHCPLSGEVTFVDIGQGDSILIREPFNRRVMLIDTGGQLRFPQPRWAQGTFTTDAAQQATVNYQKSMRIQRLDVVWLTHSDVDHIGYLPRLTHDLAVRQVVVPAGMEKLTKFRQRVPARIPVLPVTTQVKLPVTELKLLAPVQPGHAKNEDSLVLWGQFGNYRYLFTGDLPMSGERKILQRYPGLQATVLKLGHHGSRTSSSEEFLAAVQPKFGIISAGRHNRYGHPHQATLDRLAAQQVKPLSTQQYGMIRFRYRGRQTQLTTKLHGDETFWISQPSNNN